MPNRRSPRQRELLWVLATALIVTLVAIVDLELWKMSPGVPLFGSTGDSGYFLASVKGVVEHGWFWSNPDLGTPFGQSNLDFPTAFGDTLHYVLIRALEIPFDNPVHIFNAFFLLSFPLIAISAYVVLRDLGAAPPAALVTAVLFAWLPYHLLRNTGHLFLSAYYAVPFGVWLVVALAEGRTLLDRRHRSRTAATLAACVVAASASNYYAIFTMLALVLVVPLAALAWRSRQMVVQGLLVLATIGTVFALCHAPVLVHIARHGTNEVGRRAPTESEGYGLTLTRMVLPRPQHRVGPLARSGESYASQSGLYGEGFTASLGIVGTIGLVGALGLALTTGLGARTATLRRRRAGIAGALAMGCFLVGTVGGLSSVIAFELTPQVRAWNRLSLFIAFASLLTVALALTALGDRLRARGRPAWALAAIAAVVGVFGVLDQTSPQDAPDYRASKALWASDEAFVRGMEQRLAAGTSVLQLPYVPYPENIPVPGMIDYDLIRGYLHSEHLRWSYGAMKGQPADWQADAGGFDTQELAALATTAGFGAVYVDRAGYPDSGAAVSGALAKLTGGGPAGVSPDGRLQFFDLRAVAARIAAKTTPAERGALRRALLRPLAVTYGGDFYAPEATAGGTFRRASMDSELELKNPLAEPRPAILTMRLTGGGPQPSVVTILAPDGSRRNVSVTDKGMDVVVGLTIPPRGSTLRLHTEGPAAVNPPGDVRDRRLGVANPQLRDALSAPERLARLASAAG